MSNLKYVPCPLCDFNGEFWHLWTDPRPPANENKDIVCCPQCGHFFVNPVKPQDTSGLTLDHFPFDMGEEAENRFSSLYNLMMKFLPKIPIIQNHLLEVGGGVGLFQLYAKKNGWTTSGIEYATAVVESSKKKYGLDMIAGNFTELNISKKPNVIVAIEVLEHTPNPKEFVQHAFNNLNPSPNSMLFLTVPNFSTKFLKQDKSNWTEWNAMVPIGHLQYFTPGRLTQLMFEVGFHEVKLLTQCGPTNDEQIVIGACL